MYAGQAGAGGIRRTRRMKVISPRLATVADVGGRAFEWPWGSRHASGPMHAVTARRQATRHRQIRRAMLRRSVHGAPGGREGEQRGSQGQAEATGEHQLLCLEQVGYHRCKKILPRRSTGQRLSDTIHSP